MPTYDYECTKCGHVFEVFQSMSDPHVKKCPECGGKVRRLIGTGAGLIFKGQGFYITDYRSKDYHEKAKSDSAAGEKSKSDAAAAKSDAAGGATKSDTGAGKGAGEGSAAPKSDATPKSAPAPKGASGEKKAGKSARKPSRK